MSLLDRFTEDDFDDLLDAIFGPLEPKTPVVLPKEELRVACAPDDHTTGTGTHKHRCSCGTTWKHSDQIAGGGVTAEQFYEAHACPACGNEVTFKHYAKDETWN